MLNFYSFILIGQNKKEILNTVSLFFWHISYDHIRPEPAVFNFIQIPLSGKQMFFLRPHRASGSHIGLFLKFLY